MDYSLEARGEKPSRKQPEASLRRKLSWSTLESCKLKILHTTQTVNTGRKSKAQVNIRILLLLPLDNFLPCSLIQKVVDLHHRLDMLLRGLPTFPHKRVMELLGRRVLPAVCLVSWNRGHGAFGRKLCALIIRRGLRQRWHLVERVDLRSVVAHWTLCGRRCGCRCMFNGTLCPRCRSLVG